MASIRDVAVRAGVGIGTVSRTLNNSGYVSEETRLRIMKAVEEIGYKPSAIATNMVKKRTGIIGVMVPNLEHPFFAKIMKHLENELYKQGYKCLICNTLDIVNRQKSFVDMLDSRAVDGIISCVDELPDFSNHSRGAIVSFDRNGCCSYNECMRYTKKRGYRDSDNSRGRIKGKCRCEKTK